MDLFKRFAAAWAVLTASAFEAVEGKPELTEENVAALEAAASDLETTKAEMETLKGENQTHAERIAALEETEESATAFATAIVEVLEANNVDVPEGADVAAIVAEKINAWGASVPPATAAAASTADDLGDAPKEETIYSDVDRRAQERFKKNK